VWIWFDDLLVCPHCVSIWIGIPTGFIAVWWGTNRVVIAVLLGLFASLVTGLIAFTVYYDRPEDG
jgi:hypothetical protein